MSFYDPTGVGSDGPADDTSPVHPPAGWHWDPVVGNWVPDAPAPTGNTDPTTPPPPPPSAPPPTGPAPNSTPPTTPTSYAMPNAPQVPTFDPFKGPDQPFSYEPFHFNPFVAPTLQDALNEPGYAFARDQGMNALQNSAAAKGLLRSGGTLKDLIGWGDQFAQQNYANVYNRAANTWNLNNTGAFNAWQGNYNAAKGIFDTNYGVSRDVYDRNFQAAQTHWSDAYQQWLAQLEALTKISTAGAGA